MKIISVLIPCYNEATTIRTIIDRVRNVSLPANWQLELIIVDDASQDGTRNILRDYGNFFKILYHSKNQGKGSAVQTGLAQASGDYILIQDADLEYDPADIPLLLSALENSQSNVVYGSRNLGKKERRGKLIPRLGVWLLTQEFNWLYGARLTDLWTCYKLFPKSSAGLFVAGRFESELIFSARLIKSGYKISEVPISYQPRSLAEGKKIRYRDGIKGLWLLLVERFR